MRVGAIVALIIGKTYDKWGLMVLVAIPALTLPIPFPGFFTHIRADTVCHSIVGCSDGNP